MKKIQNPKIARFVRSVKPWGIFIGILLLLKVTGALSEISFFAGSAIMKTGAFDIRPQATVSSGETFNYNFVVKDLDGKKMELSELKGKVIFLNLWATWCGPCRMEMPSIQSLYNSVDHDKIAFVMLSLDQDNQQEKIVNFISEKAFTFPVYQPASPLPKLLRVNTIPSTFIIGADGKVVTKKTGTANYDTEKFKAFLEDLTQIVSEP
jgi:thiol-disulfide isomerase/thioredoxin